MTADQSFGGGKNECEDYDVLVENGELDGSIRLYVDKPHADKLHVLLAAKSAELAKKDKWIASLERMNDAHLKDHAKLAKLRADLDAVIAYVRLPCTAGWSKERIIKEARRATEGEQRT